ncbi:BAH domain-containing protein [Ditylenchus destructor]|nr:BAH domain-containing protein [Ditylenchus destructor]
MSTSTLVNSRGIQVRVNEAVYVERLINDEHKQALKKLHEECAKSGTTPTKKNVELEKSSKCVSSPKKSKRDSDSKRHEKNGTHDESDKRLQNVWWEPPTKGLLKGEFHRRDLRTFRVERIFTGPNGQPFVFGVYYARPHETFCDSTRMFYENELFWTPLFDTLPLDSVVGRCLILEPQVWASGRPKSPKYLEEDVFICEYQIDKHQRCFEKILPKNRYFINTESYVFDYYPEKLPLKRDFTPFILPSRSEKSDQKPKVAQPLAINPLTKDMNKQNLESICSRIQAIKDPN